MEETLTVEFDGGSRGNPGPAGIGVVIRAHDKTALVALGRFIGRATNNVAEYRALIAGLEKARELGARRLHVRGDSELIIRQMLGQYRVKNADLRTLHDQAQELVNQFDEVKFEHNLREKNKLADKLANKAMDRKAEVVDLDESPLDAPTPTAPQPGDRVSCARCGCVVEIVKPSSIRPHQMRAIKCPCGAEIVKPSSIRPHQMRGFKCQCGAEMG